MALAITTSEPHEVGTIWTVLADFGISVEEVMGGAGCFSVSVSKSVSDAVSEGGEQECPDGGQWRCSIRITPGMIRISLRSLREWSCQEGELGEILILWRYMIYMIHQTLHPIAIQDLPRPSSRSNCALSQTKTSSRPCYYGATAGLAPSDSECPIWHEPRTHSRFSPEDPSCMPSSRGFLQRTSVPQSTDSAVLHRQYA